MESVLPDRTGRKRRVFCLGRKKRYIAERMQSCQESIKINTQKLRFLLAMVGEIKEDMGTARAREEIFAEYKRKYPRHSSFQKR